MNPEIKIRNNGKMEYWKDGQKMKFLNPLFHHSSIPIFQWF
jgi:hypothetical protein